MRIEEALEDFVLQLQADGRSPHTVNQYRRHVALLASWVGDREVEEIDHPDIARFLTSEVVRCRVDGEPRKPTSKNAIRSSLRVFFSYVRDAGYVETNAARLVRRARCPPGPPRALSQAEQARLVAALDGAKTDAEKRDRALFRTMLASGARISEILEVRIEDLDLDQSELRLRKVKGGGEDTLLLPVAVAQILAEYVGERHSGWLFEGQGERPLTPRQAARRLQEWLGRAGIRRRASPHVLRHSFGQHIYERTGDLLLTQAAMRHRSPVSTVIYAHASRSQLRRVMEL